MVKPRFAVDERAREEDVWGVRRWRRVCWRRVRMHDVQTVEEDIAYVGSCCCWYTKCWRRMVMVCLPSPSKFPMMRASSIVESANE
jgi:hypothetical protein